jgi:hypothetical protein
MTILVVVLILLYYGLHQDFWNWYAARPLAFGFLPPGLLYHAFYTLGAAVFMAFLVRFAWPRDLELWADTENTPK